MGRRCPQLAHPMAEQRFWLEIYRGNRLRNGQPRFRQLVVLPKIALAEESAIQAVGLVMMLGLEVTGTVAALVFGVNGIVVDMQRRQRHHGQVGGQQDNRGNMSQRAVCHFIGNQEVGYKTSLLDCAAKIYFFCQMDHPYLWGICHLDYPVDNFFVAIGEKFVYLHFQC